MNDAATTERSTEHATFEIERTYAHERANVFAAFADLGLKSRWFGDADMVERGTQTLEFREGGVETLRMSMADGTAMTYDARYMDIVPDARIVYAYEMSMGGRRISTTIASVEFTEVANGTRLVLTEHGIFLDGLDRPSLREHGTEQLLDRLGASLDEGASA